MEEQFYLVWPLCVYFLSRWALRNLCITLFAGAVLARWACWLIGTDERLAYMMTPCHLDAIAAGAFISIVCADPENRPSFVRWAKWAGALGALTFLASIYWAWLNGTARELMSEPVCLVFGVTGLKIFFASILTLAVYGPSSSTLKSFLHFPFLAVLGKYSYAVYLFHTTVNRVLIHTIMSQRTFPKIAGSRLLEQLCLYILLIGFNLALAYLSWHLFEKQILKLKRFFPLTSKQR